jgi:hypothetical protein
MLSTCYEAKKVAQWRTGEAVNDRIRADQGSIIERTDRIVTMSSRLKITP